MPTLENLIRFLRVGVLLHLIALVASGLSIWLWLAVARQDQGVHFVFIALLIWLSIIPLFAELDAYSRLQNYKQIKDQLYFNGYQERILKPMVKSRCQRDACMVACVELGLKSSAQNYFDSFGYRWYHIIPDFVWQYPMFLLSGYFWRSTFFVPYYQSKVDYSTIDISLLDLMVSTPNLEASV